MKPLLSIIIPIYNEEKDIKECLMSLNKQSFKDFEIIIVDDGSSDRTVEIVDKTSLEEGISLRILNQNHSGPGKARNYGANNSNGDILVFIDADMTFEKDYLKNLIEPILKENARGTTHDCEIATNTDNKYSHLWGKVRVSKESAKAVNIFRAIRKEKFIELGGFDPKYGYADDQTLWFKYGIKPAVAENTICYHKNPETLEETYKHAVWIGTSWKERYKVFQIPLLNYLFVLGFGVVFPFLALDKSFKYKINRADISRSDIIKFYFFKFKGYYAGVFNAVYKGIGWK